MYYSFEVADLDIDVNAGVVTVTPHSSVGDYTAKIGYSSDDFGARYSNSMYVKVCSYLTNRFMLILSYYVVHDVTKLPVTVRRSSLIVHSIRVIFISFFFFYRFILHAVAAWSLSVHNSC